MYDKTKAEAAAYAVEIELLTRAMTHCFEITGVGGDWPEIERVKQSLLIRLNILLDLEEIK
jgi:hypothetical protein